MRCSACNAENAETRRFCAACGAPLSRACAICDFRNQPDARFCGGCGAPLSMAGSMAGAPDRPSKETPQLIPAGELRQVAILFADLVGFVQLSSERDPEDMHVVLERVFEVIDDLVESYGGTVDKHIGDAVMALFGAPVAHDDDPLRAARTAIEIHAAIAKLGTELGQPLSVHIGVAAGEVIAAGLGRDDRQEYTVVGDSVNLAARLNELAGPGETLISDTVQRSILDHAECELVGETKIKGLAKSVPIWRLRALGERTASPWRTPFVGRSGEQRQFAGILASCRETGCGHAVLIRGEAGIGKTRLVEAFATAAEDLGFAVHRALVLDFGVGRGQDAIRALLRDLLAVASGANAEARQAAADEVVRTGLVSADKRVFLNDLLDLPQPLAFRAMYDAMDNAVRSRGKQELATNLIRQASTHQPLLLIVEDIHWADAAMLAYLAGLTATVKDCAAVLVMTARTEGDPLDQTWRGTTRGAPLTTIDLGPLRREEATAMAGAFIDATNRRAAACIERADGNPLFLEQLLRNAKESAEEDVPASIQSLVLARTDRLPARDRQALQAASVIGQRLSLETLRHLIGDPGYGCATLVRHCLLTPDGEDYLFAHALIQQGVYASLLKARRRALHRRAAEWFAGRDPTLRAQHLDRAGDPAAPTAYLQAARAQAAEYRYERALQLVDAGLALAQADRFALLLLRGELLHDLGNIPESIACHHQALEVARDDADRCRAWIGLAAGLRMADRYTEALDALDRAEAAATAGDSIIERARLHHLRGNLYFPLGRIAACREEHERALRLAREAGSPEAEAQALGGLGDAEYVRGRMLTADRYFSRCIALCGAHGFGRIEVANRPMAAICRYYSNDLQGALARALEAIEAAARVGHQRAEMIGHHSAFMISFEMEDFARAGDHVAQAHEISTHLGAKRFEAEDIAFLSVLRRAQGHRPEAVALARDALAICRKTGMDYIGPVVLACLACATDDPALRESAMAEAEAILDAGSVSHNHLWFHRDAMELALTTGDWDRAERYAAALEAYTRAEPLPWSDLHIARARALAAFGRGRRDANILGTIRHLRDESRRVGLALTARALDAALSPA